MSSVTQNTLETTEQPVQEELEDEVINLSEYGDCWFFPLQETTEVW